MQEKQLPIPVIMAGGQGHRLRPLTDTLPKPLVPVAGEAALFRILRLLRQHGYGEAILSLCYRAEQIRTACGTKACGVRLFYSFEQTPLGTAGGVRQALLQHARFSGRQILVLSGDAICTFDLTAAYQAHLSAGAEATLLLSRAAEVGSLGVVQCEQNGRVHGFSEKPSPFGAAWDTVNTGIYFLRPALLDRIPKNTEYDFGKDLFPSILRMGEKLQGVLGDGFWCDIGTLDALYRTSFAIAHGEIAGLRAPSHLLRGSSLVGENCRIAPDAVLRESILFDGSTVCSGAVIEGAILGGQCHIGAQAELRCGSVLGSGVTVAPGAVLRGGTRLDANTACALRVENTDNPSKMDKTQTEKILFDGSFALGDRFSRSEILLFSKRADLIFCTRFGGALAKAKQGHTGTLLLCHDGQKICAAAARLIGAAASAGGAAVYLMGEGSYPELQYLCQITAAAIGGYLRFDGKRCTVRLCDENGLYPTRKTERAIFSALFEDAPHGANAPCELQTFSGTRTLLCGGMRGALAGEGRVSFSLLGKEANRVLAPYFAAFGRHAVQGAPLGFCLSALGALTVFSRGEEYDAYAITGCLLFHFAESEGKKTIALPSTAPSYLYALCKERNIAVQPVFHCPGSAGSCQAARRLYAENPMLHNAVFSAVFLLDLLECCGMSLCELAREAKLSPVRIRRRASIALRPGESGTLMRVLAQELSAACFQREDAVELKTAGGALTLYPRRKTALSLVADAAGSEAAQELLASGEEELLQLLKRLRAAEKEGER